MDRFKKVALASLSMLPLLFGCSTENNVKVDKLIVWTTESDPKAVAAMAELEKSFEAKHKGVDIVIETVGWNDLSEKLIAASHSGAWPDVSHIQPFMAFSLYDTKELLPLTDVRDLIEAQNGPIFPVLRDLQTFKDQTGKEDVYGLPYAVGTTFWSVRADAIPSGTNLNSVNSWNDYLLLTKASHKVNPQTNTVTLPGGSPFFMDQLFSEIVANAGGVLFDPAGCPVLTSTPVVETLGFFSALAKSGVLSEDWATQKYTDQFSRLGNGSVFSVPVTYARSAQTVRDIYTKNGQNPDSANDKSIRWLNQPTSDGKKTSIATIDAEPWVVFSASAKRVQSTTGERNDELAKDFLKMYYSADFYAKFTKQVPIQLTPIFEKMANDPSYVETTRPFGDWHQRTIQHLTDGSARPILMPDISSSGKQLPFLLDFQRAGILSRAISAVVKDKKAPEQVAADSQKEAIDLVRKSGKRRCGG